MLDGAGGFRHAVKSAIAHGLYYSGLLGLWQTVALRHRAVVLMYHRVLEPEQAGLTGSHPGIIVTQDTFARHMAVLKRRFTVLSLDAFADHLERKIPLPHSSCVVTFDDGWKDNVVNGLPVLKRHGIPALVFLPTNFIGHRRVFWREALTHVLVAAIMASRTDSARRARFADLLGPLDLGSVLDIEDEDPRAVVIDFLGRQRLLAAPAEALIAALTDVLGRRVEDMATPDTFMDWADVDAMERSGTAFGGHGVEHRPLALATLEEARDEIQGSKAVVSARFPGTVPTFSYPNGSLNHDVVNLVRAAGYRFAFTTEPGAVRCTDDPLRLRRVNIHEDMTSSTPMFLARLVGLF